MKCPKCQIEYVEAKTDFEYQEIIMRNVDCLKCPKCGVALFTPEQYDMIRKRFSGLAPTLRLTRKVSAAGKRPAVYLPKDIVKAVGLKIGDEIDIYLQGKNRIVIELANTTRLA